MGNMSILFEFMVHPDCVDALSLLWKELILNYYFSSVFPSAVKQRTIYNEDFWSVTSACSHVFLSFNFALDFLGSAV